MDSFGFRLSQKKEKKSSNNNNDFDSKMEIDSRLQMFGIRNRNH